MNRFGRRTFLKRAATAAAAGVLSRRSLAAPANAPNILVCVADDWSYGFASAHGSRTALTPTFDRLSRDGVAFSRAFSIAPTCSAARAGLLTGRPPHRLEQGANLWGTLPAKFPVYPDILEQAGYAVGYAGKGYGPGIDGDRPRNPAGPRFSTFTAFLQTVPPTTPFCFWFGSTDPHRPYDRAFTRSFGMRREDVVVPAYLPDVPAVRDDLLDVAAEVRRFDADLARLLTALDVTGRSANTLVVVTSDNGMPFPRAKANLYDAGTRMPLVIYGPELGIRPRSTDALVSQLDLAPTFLELIGVDVPAEMAGASLLGLLRGTDPFPRRRVFAERERHARARASNLGYPSRAIRTERYLYIRNFAPSRWPAGDPTGSFPTGIFGDIDEGPSKTYLLEHRGEPGVARLFGLACGKRPGEELYDVVADPWQLTNLAGRAEFDAIRADLRSELMSWMAATADPRALGPAPQFDRYPYYGR